MPQVAEVWRRGSVIASWLLDLTAEALLRVADARRFRGPRVGFGRGPLDGARRDRRGRPRQRASAALFARFGSRGEAVYGDKLLSAMRKQFGGHDEKHTGDRPWRPLRGREPRSARVASLHGRQRLW